MFSLASKFYQGCLIIYQLIVLNILFILFSLPVFTMGAAFSALTATLRGQHGTSLFQPFYQAFKTSFKSSLPLLGFNLLSLLFVINLQMISTGSSLLLHLLKLIFISFIFSYNINIYIVSSKEQSSLLANFRWAFVFTIGTFVKTCLIPLGSLAIIYFFLSVMGYMTFLFFVSLPTMIYLVVVKKELNMIENPEQLEGEVIEPNQGGY